MSNSFLAKQVICPKNISLSLILCFLYDFLVCLYGVIFLILTKHSSLEAKLNELIYVLLIDLVFIVLFSFRKIPVKIFVPYIFISIMGKSYFDLVFSDAGHVVLTQIAFIMSLYYFATDDRVKKLTQYCCYFAFLLAYVFSGFQKLRGLDYYSGEAIIKVFSTPAWNVDYYHYFQEFSSISILFMFLGNFILVFEFVLPILFVFFEQTRKTFLFLLICFHLIIYFLMDLTTFPIFMILLALGILGPSVGFSFSRTQLHSLLAK